MEFQIRERGKSLSFIVHLSTVILVNINLENKHFYNICFKSSYHSWNSTQKLKTETEKQIRWLYNSWYFPSSSDIHIFLRMSNKSSKILHTHNPSLRSHKCNIQTLIDILWQHNFLVEHSFKYFVIWSPHFIKKRKVRDDILI